MSHLVFFYAPITDATYDKCHGNCSIRLFVCFFVKKTALVARVDSNEMRQPETTHDPDCGAKEEVESSARGPRFSKIANDQERSLFALSSSSEVPAPRKSTARKLDMI